MTNRSTGTTQYHLFVSFRSDQKALILPSLSHSCCVYDVLFFQNSSHQFVQSVSVHSDHVSQEFREPVSYYQFQVFDVFVDFSVGSFTIFPCHPSGSRERASYKPQLKVTQRLANVYALSQPNPIEVCCIDGLLLLLSG